jgi:hypothetical protein
VNWITFVGKEPSQDASYRAAQADFNVRGWQGRWRYTASAALFFSGLVPNSLDQSAIFAGA